MLSFQTKLLLQVLLVITIFLKCSAESKEEEEDDEDEFFEKFDSFKLGKLQGLNNAQVTYIELAIENLENWIEIHNLNEEQEKIVDEVQKLIVRRKELSELGDRIKAKFANILNTFDEFYIENVGSVHEFHELKSKFKVLRDGWEDNQKNYNLYTTGAVEFNFMHANMSVQIVNVSERKLKLQHELLHGSNSVPNVYSPFYLHATEYGMVATDPLDLALTQHDDLIKKTGVSDMYFKVAEISLMNLKEILGILKKLNELGYFKAGIDTEKKRQDQVTESNISEAKNKLLSIMLNYRQLMEKTKSVYGTLSFFVYVVRKAHFTQERSQAMLTEATELTIQDTLNSEEINKIATEFRQRIETFEQVRKSFLNGESSAPVHNKIEL